MTRRTLLLAAPFLAAFAIVADAGERVTLPEHPGYLPYRRYCASCHGVFADGNGPVAPVLNAKPTDLTRLSEKYGTPLPVEKLAAFIDGRAEVGSHGPREMPVWGEQLFGEMPAQTADLAEWARGKTIQRIVEYLQAVQATD